MKLGSASLSAVHILLPGASLIIILALSYRFFRTTSNGLNGKKGMPLPLPPGPKPLPFLGNILDMPRQHEWETITRWGRKYGDVVRVTVLGQNIVFLNSAKAVSDLFEKRSAIYSDRPRLPLLNELVGHDWNFGFMAYGETWRKHRRMFVSKFGPTNVQNFNQIQLRAATLLVKRLLDAPNDFLDHLRLHSGQLIMMSTYGIHIESRDDRYVQVAEAVMDACSEAARPGAMLIDVLPILKYIPAWFPGAVYQRVAKRWASDLEELRWNPFLVAKARLRDGKQSSLSCYVTELLEESETGDADAEAMIRDTAALAYGTGSDTSVSTLVSFVLAMVLFPDVQRKAQAELDAVVGSSRLPSYSDRQCLPYITAIAKESLRWHNVGPQGLPHQLREDDVYNGMFIPAGSIVIGNSWGILHDAKMYPNPMEFSPERYLNARGNLDYKVNDPAKYAFGYGRRVCPGYHFAENTLWITIAYILSNFNITPALGSHGRSIPVALNPSSGIVSHPASFGCSITPRSGQARMLIQQAIVQGG